MASGCINGKDMEDPCDFLEAVYCVCTSDVGSCADECAEAGAAWDEVSDEDKAAVAEYCGWN